MKDRNYQIAEYLKQNPIQKGTRNAYKEVCEKFGVNKDVIKGVLRTIEGRRRKPDNSSEKITVDIKNFDDFVQSNKIDLSKYNVNKVKNSYWKSGENDNYAISVELTPKVEELQDSLLDSIKNVLSNIERYTFKENSVSSDGNSINVYLSDIHVGANITNEGLYDIEYNDKVLQNRLKELYKRIIKHVKTFGKFEDLFLINLGDSLDGFNNQTTRGGHHLPQNMTNKEQFENYLKLMIEFCDSIIESGEICDNFHFYSVGDSNHDGDLQYIVNRTLEIYLQNRYNVDTNVFRKFMGHYSYGEHTFILTHGKDKINLKHGLPLTLNEKTENFINDYIYQNNIRSKYIHLVKGDLHQSATQYSKRFRYKNCMSIFGSSEWSMMNFGSGYCGTDIEILLKDGSILEDKLFHTNK